MNCSLHDNFELWRSSVSSWDLSVFDWISYSKNITDIRSWTELRSNGMFLSPDISGKRMANRWMWRARRFSWGKALDRSSSKHRRSPTRVSTSAMPGTTLERQYLSSRFFEEQVCGVHRRRLVWNIGGGGGPDRPGWPALYDNLYNEL